jgi:hypothetical protein
MRYMDELTGYNYIVKENPFSTRDVKSNSLLWHENKLGWKGIRRMM